MYHTAMPDELLNVLARFHREVVVPDIERIVTDTVLTRIDSLRDEMLSHFDALYKRLDRRESEYQAGSRALSAHDCR